MLWVSTVGANVDSILRNVKEDSSLLTRIRFSSSTGLSARDTLLPIEARGVISGGFHVWDVCLPPACYRGRLRSLCTASWVKESHRFSGISGYED